MKKKLCPDCGKKINPSPILTGKGEFYLMFIIAPLAIFYSTFELLTGVRVSSTANFLMLIGLLVGFALIIDSRILPKKYIVYYCKSCNQIIGAEGIELEQFLRDQSRTIKIRLGWIFASTIAGAAIIFLFLKA